MTKPQYYIGKTRLSQIKCRRCNSHIPKGSYCLFTDYTWCKYCLNCGKKRMGLRLEKLKEEIVRVKKLVKQMSKEKLIKENMCASLRS